MVTLAGSKLDRVTHMIAEIHLGANVGNKAVIIYLYYLLMSQYYLLLFIFLRDVMSQYLAY